jgi:uncharacterized protein YaaQ
VKLVIAVLESRYGPAALRRLAEAGFGATQLASSGGFLRRGNATLLIGVDDERVDEVLEVLRASSPKAEVTGPGGAPVSVRGAAWVTRVADFRKV